MRSLNLDQLRTLVAIADLGSFSNAARTLHLSQPTVSLHISELESRLGARLLDRSDRRVRPTAAGTALVERARALLHDAQEAADLVKRHAQGLVGRVRLGASTVVVTHLLPAALDWLSQHHPGIDVELGITGSLQAAQRLREGSLDIGIVSLPLASEVGLEIRPWRSDPMAAYLPPRWEAPATVTPQWLAQRPLVLNDSSTNMSRLTAAWFAKAGYAPKARIELNYDEVIKKLVMAGYGASVLPLEPSADAAQLQAQVQIRPLRPALRRRLGVALRRTAAAREPPLEIVLGVLESLRQR
ncbi:LysR family transcriptional regulator [Methylibium rhizosphaerae]|uniref:LysR family transcriptional regulator n=1 Tax=Methylibium rhizosphaerae TaxID=2570323 RepID=UPI00112733A4|nr:LysR family transcriptional regulator [Methylibium rhizosphaerae]